MNIFMFIKRQASKDNTKDRFAIVNSIFDNIPFLSFLYKLIDTSCAKPIIAALWAASRAGFHAPDNNKLVVIAWSANEKKGIRSFFSSIHFDDFTYLNWRTISNIPYFFLFIISGVNNKKIIQIIRISSLLSKRYPLYVVGRSLEALLTYLFIHSIRPHLLNKTFLISTESNPICSALNSLAKERSLKLIYLAHSPYIDNVAALYLYAGIFWGPAMLTQICDAGGYVEHPLYYFSKEVKYDELINDKEVILISLSKSPNWSGVDKIIAQLKNKSSLMSKKIKIRSHPNYFGRYPENLKAYMAKDESLAELLQQSVFMIAGNSTVHLESFYYNIPSYISLAIEEDDKITLPFLDEGVFSLDDLLENDYQQLDLYSENFYIKIQDTFFTNNNIHNVSERFIKLISGF